MTPLTPEKLRKLAKPYIVEWGKAAAGGLHPGTHAETAYRLASALLTAADRIEILERGEGKVLLPGRGLERSDLK